MADPPPATRSTLTASASSALSATTLATTVTRSTELAVDVTRIRPARFSIAKFAASAPESSARIVRSISDAGRRKG